MLHLPWKVQMLIHCSMISLFNSTIQQQSYIIDKIYLLLRLCNVTHYYFIEICWIGLYLQVRIDFEN